MGGRYSRTAMARAAGVHPRVREYRPDLRRGVLDYIERCVVLTLHLASERYLDRRGTTVADDEREERLLDALNFALNMIENENIVKLARYQLSMSGEEIIEELGLDERIAFATPADVIVGGKGEPGMIILCEDRVILNWSTGIRKPETHIESMPIDDNLNVTKELKKLGILKGLAAVACFRCVSRLMFHNVFMRPRGTLNEAGQLTPRTLNEGP